MIPNLEASKDIPNETKRTIIENTIERLQNAARAMFAASPEFRKFMEKNKKE
jgi:hypothetical protein